MFCFEYYTLNAKVSILKNGLDLSNLSVYKDISTEELGRTGNIMFNETDLNRAYNTFSSYLKKNFNLDGNLVCKNANSFIYGKLDVTDFRIYNVIDNRVTEYKYNLSSGTFIKILDNVNYPVNTPNNKKVDKTSIYTQIDVNMKMIFKYSDENNSKKITVASYTDAVN